MKIQHVHLQQFTTHADRAFSIPDSGIVGVTGSNGSGKSSILEAVSWVVYGKTLRGADPSQCRVYAKVGGWEITRKKPSKDTIGVTDSSGEDRTCDTPTKTQEVLDANFLPFDRWRRVCVFSSADAAHFSLATDSERKRFLEKVLGIDRFDTGEVAARAALAPAVAEFAIVSRNIDAQRELYANLLKKKNDSKAMLASLTPPPEPYTAEQVDGAKSVIEKAQVIQAAYKVDLQMVQARATDLKRKIDSAKAGIALAKDTCGACNRKFDNAEDVEKHRAGMLDQLGSLQAELATLQTATSKPDRVSQAEAAESAASKIELARAQWIGRMEGHKKTELALQKSIDAAEAELAEIKTYGAQLSARKTALRSDIDELELCVKVLGTRGARVLYLAEAVAQIEALANTYLTDLSPPEIQLKIHTQTPKKGGGFSDTLSIETIGECGATYDALSGGQRRRVDIALLLALADISAAMSDVKGSTLFFDEVFDALDSDGCEAVARLLERISQNRAVVLITHNKFLLETVKLTDCIRL